MADREGFEPSNGFHRYTLSRRAPSTTRPPVRIGKWGNTRPLRAPQGPPKFPFLKDFSIVVVTCCYGKDTPVASMAMASASYQSNSGNILSHGGPPLAINQPQVTAIDYQGQSLAQNEGRIADMDRIDQCDDAAR